jgi:tetratricopeptide (TPR) repeat protein
MVETQNANTNGENADKRPFNKGGLLSISCIVLAITCVFFQIPGQDFVVWDDSIHVYANRYLDPVNGANLIHFWKVSYEGLYIPLSYMTYAGIATLGQISRTDTAITDTGALLNPHYFKTANLILHILNALLVFSILRTLTKNIKAATAATLFFALHPIQVEAVAWISELRGLQGSFFLLLSLRFYLNIRQSAHTSLHARINFGAFYACAICALLSKPSTAVLCLIVPVLDIYFFQIAWRKSLVVASPIMIGSLLIMGLTTQAQAINPAAQSAIWFRPFIAGDSLAFYIWKLFIPLNLGIDYGRSPAFLRAHNWVYFIWLIPAGIAVAVWRLSSQYRYLTPSGLIFVIALLPVLGLVPFSFQYYSDVTDRYVYLGMLGLALALAFALKNAKRPAQSYAILGIVLGIYAFLSYVQVGYWQDSLTLMSHTVAVNDQSITGHGNLGVLYDKAELPQDAAVEYRKTVSLDPNNGQAHFNFANSLMGIGDQPSAIAEYKRAVALEPDNAESYFRLGIIAAQSRDLAEASFEFRNAVRVEPRYTYAHEALGKVVASEGNLTEACKHFKDAIATNPSYVPAYIELALAQNNLGDRSDALATINQAKKMAPNYLPLEEAIRQLAQNPQNGHEHH